MAKLGITMIDMYCAMVRDDFNPLIISLTARATGVKDKVELQVKKDMGVYHLYQKKAELELALKEVKEKLSDVEGNDYIDGLYQNKIQHEVKRRLDLINEPLKEVKRQRDSMIRQIKMSGIGDDIKQVFEAVPSILEDLVSRFGNLPAITDKELKQISKGV
jgi:hypothetical protein